MGVLTSALCHLPYALKTPAAGRAPGILWQRHDLGQDLE